MAIRSPAPPHRAAVPPAEPTIGPFAPELPFERLLSARRSVRAFAAETLRDEELAALLWAAQGVTDAEGHRTAPSAGARYPLEVLLVTADGVFRYDPSTGVSTRTRIGDRRGQLAEAAWSEPAVALAPATVVIATVQGRTEAKYGPVRGPAYVHMEAGAAGENVLLEAVALGLGAVIVGAFEDRRVQLALGLRPAERPICLIPVGRPR